MAENSSSETALAHLAMIVLAAKGEYSPRKDEIEKRYAAIVAFIRSGQCVAGEADTDAATDALKAIRGIL